VHGFLTRDGTAPAELHRIGRDQLAAYPDVEIADGTVEIVTAGEDGFDVELTGGRREHGRRLLLATGVVDELPPVPGLAELWGSGVLYCPYCHGWEVRDTPLAVLGQDTQAAQIAIYLTRLSDDVILCTNGGAEIDTPIRHVLSTLGVSIRDERVTRVHGQPGRLELIFDTRGALERHALFLRPRTRQRSDLPARLGCTVPDDGKVQVDQQGRTSVAGVYAAGDLCRTPDRELPADKVINAASAGAVAALVALLLVPAGKPPAGLIPQAH
jgi:thioredoxin reductase